MTDLNSKIDDCMHAYADELLVDKFMKILREALASTALMFDVHKNTQFGPMTVFVEELGPGALRLGAQITVQRYRDLDDHPMPTDAAHAGARILTCYKVRSTINHPAINEEVTSTVAALDKAAQFARIIYNASQRLESMLFWDRTALGYKFLKDSPNP